MLFRSLSLLAEQEKERLDRKETADAELRSEGVDLFDVVDEEVIAEVLAAWTGIPVYRLTEEETAKLLRMEDELHKRVIGQEEALKALSRAIRRTRAGLKDPKRPSGSFIFLGPTGVGKTELAKTLAEFLFDDEDALIQLDMSEYMEKHTVSRLVGSPPGYVGYEEGGQLTEAVRRKPFSVVLFDEVEKAHPDVFNTLLQILEDGRLTDAQGRTVDFKNTVIIMTSNVGSPYLLDGVTDEGEIQPQARNRVMDELRGHSVGRFSSWSRTRCRSASCGRNSGLARQLSSTWRTRLSMARAHNSASGRLRASSPRRSNWLGPAPTRSSANPRHSACAVRPLRGRAPRGTNGARRRISIR